MGNETSLDNEKLQSYQHTNDAHSDDDDDKKEEKKASKDALEQQTYDYVTNFHGKWLSHIRLRPIIIRNKLYGMHNIMNKPELNELLSRFDDMIIHHSGIEIILNSDNCNQCESYLILPHYTSIITDSCKNGWHNNINQIILTIKCELMNNIDIIESKTMYGNNYGIIDNITFNEHDEANIYISNKGIYDKYLFENQQFLSKCILPIDILKMICFDFIGSSHNDVHELNIYNVAITDPDPDQNNVYFSWLCHKLQKRNCTENIIYNTGINLCGSYFNLETIIDVHCYTDHCRMLKIQREHNDNDNESDDDSDDESDDGSNDTYYIEDGIIGTTLYKLSRQIS